MQRNLLPLIVFTLWVQVVLTGCSPSYEEMAKTRHDYAYTKPDELFIAGLEPFGQYYNIEGMEMALDEINSNPSYLKKKTLQLKKFQDKYEYTEILPTIRAIANDPSLVAVIGHPTSNDAVPAAAIYELAQLPFVSTAATSSKLSVNGRIFTFRLFPDHKEEAQQLSTFIQVMGYKHVIIINDRDELNADVALLIKRNLSQAGISVSKSSSFFYGQSLTGDQLEDIKSAEADAIVISSWTEDAVQIFQQLSSIGVKKPLILTNSVSSIGFSNDVGFTDTPVISIDTYSASSPSSKNKNFIHKYLGRNGQTPEQSAANSYSFVMFLGEAIHHALENTEILTTKAIINELRGKRLWHGFSGYQSFNDYGEITGLDFQFSKLQDGIWVPLPGMEVMLRESHLAVGGIDSHSRVSSGDNLGQLLTYSKKILEFENLGTFKITDDSQQSRARDESLRQAALDTDFFLKQCYINPLDKNDAHMLNCISKMSGQIDAFLLPQEKSISDSLYEKMLLALDNENIPVVAINHSRNIARNATLALSEDIDIPSFTEIREVYEKITDYQRLGDFYKHLQQAPKITVNARHVSKYNMTNKGLLALEAEAIQEDGE